MNIVKPAKQIEREVRTYLKENIDLFPRPESFVGFSEAVQKKESELINELTSFYLDVQQQTLNPLPEEKL